MYSTRYKKKIIKLSKHTHSPTHTNIYILKVEYHRIFLNGKYQWRSYGRDRETLFTRYFLTDRLYECTKLF